MNCPNCGAPMQMAGPGSYLYCRYCSTFHFPSATRDDVAVIGIESGEQCPVCDSELVAASVGSVHTLYCQQCHGLLLDQPSFGSLVVYLRARAPNEPALPQPLNRDDLKRQLYCPRCHTLMDTHPYYGPGNIVIDICLGCRLVWLDHGELSAIRDAP